MHFASASPYYFFDREDAAARERELKRDADAAVPAKRQLHCARCRHRITADDQRIAVNGSAEHDCINPSGLRFRIACFRRAPGCTAQDSGTIEHTWFAGYTWSIASCASCGTHLGWRFASVDDAFYGLIVDRLTG